MFVPDEFAITIQKPGHQSAWTQWLLWKQNPNITPPNLRNRSWHDFPGTEVQVSFMVTVLQPQSLTLTPTSTLQERSPGPPFGTDMGRGLTLRTRSVGSAPQQPPVRSCPNILEMRELYQHRRMDKQLKDIVDSRLKVKYVCRHMLECVEALL